MKKESFLLTCKKNEWRYNWVTVVPGGSRNGRMRIGTAGLGNALQMVTSISLIKGLSHATRGAITPGGYKRDLPIGQNLFPYHRSDAIEDTGTYASDSIELSRLLQNKSVTRSHRVNPFA